MLKKLLKYEFRATARTYGGMYLALLAASVLFGGSVRRWNGTNSDAYSTLVGLLSLVYTAVIIGTVVVTIMTIVQRFYRNLLGREGYLMHTLPVTETQLVTSKLISSTVWSLCSILAACLSFGILAVLMMADMDLLEQLPLMWSIIREAFARYNMEFWGALAFSGVVGFVRMVSAIACIYAACMVGHQFKNHPALAGILSFFVMQYVQGWLEKLLQIGTGVYETIIYSAVGDMGSIETAISKTMDVLEGAYSLVIMSATKLIAVRDPRGYRPLCIGTLPGGGYVFASESCALDATGASLLRDVEPGEIVVVDTKTGELRSIKDHCGRPDTQMCVFEFIYFARPDSVIEGSSVHEARKQAGRFLAQEHPVEADVVIGVPDSGLDAALGYSQESGIPYGIGFIKNKYIGRTFIQGSQKQRENSVRIKLNVVTSTVKGKRVVLVDDSIVRGTTSARIIKLLRDAGAKEVHFRVSAPPFKYPCYFGTDIPDQKLLVATGRTVDQINEIIGADTLGYLSTEHVVQLAQNANCGFCTACFTGKYAVKPEEVLSTDIHERHLNDRPKDEKKLGE